MATELNKMAYFVLLAAYIGAVVLIALKREDFDQSIKIILEGLTVAGAFLALVGTVLLFYSKKNFKNSLLFLITNIMVCAITAGIIVMYVRDEQNNKTEEKNIIFMLLISVVAFLSTFVLINDLLGNSFSPLATSKK